MRSYHDGLCTHIAAAAIDAAAAAAEVETRHTDQLAQLPRQRQF